MSQVAEQTELKRPVDLGVYEFARAAVTKYHKLGSFKQQKHIVSQLWRLEIQDQGVGRVGSF